jgi:hypothetical protein
VEALSSFQSRKLLALAPEVQIRPLLTRVQEPKYYSDTHLLKSGPAWPPEMVRLSHFDDENQISNNEGSEITLPQLSPPLGN